MSGMRGAGLVPGPSPGEPGVSPGTRGNGCSLGYHDPFGLIIFMPNGPGPHDRGMWFAAGAARVTYMTSRIQNLPEPLGRAR